MHANAKLFARAVTFARRAADTSLTDAERDTATTAFATHCDKHNIDAAAAIAAASKPEAVKRVPLTPTQAAAVATATAKRVKPAPKPEAPKAAPKPKPEAAKPEQPTKPNASDKRTDYDKRVALIGELRVSVSALYNGPSLAVRTNPKRFASSVYADLLATPKHRTTLAKLSVRDESALFLIIKRGERNGSFDPAALNLDAGIFSRLASVGFIEADGAETFKLSSDALAHARIVAKRAA